MTKNDNAKTYLITSGATRERIDAVRFISNPSSGKTGYYLANEAVSRGNKVIFITGPSGMKPEGCEVFVTESAADMLAAVKKNVSRADVVIGAAAVGDFRVGSRFQDPGSKMERKNKITLELEPTTDILAEIGKRKGKKIIVGFSAEAGQSLEKTKQKIRSKNLDLVVFNDITKKGAGFESDANEITVLDNKGKKVLQASGHKKELAIKILDLIEKL